MKTVTHIAVTEPPFRILVIGTTLYGPLVVHRSPRFYPFMADAYPWVVSDRESGRSVGYGTTRRRAVHDTWRLVTNYQRFIGEPNPLTALAHARAQRQKTKQI